MANLTKAEILVKQDIAIYKYDHDGETPLTYSFTPSFEETKLEVSKPLNK